MEKIAIIILNYNGLPYVLSCLSSLKLSTISYQQLTIILVDNNSSDDSVKIIEKEFPKVKLIKNKKNLGFSKGNNIGIKYALKNNFDYIMLLNPDTVVEKGFLKPLLKLFRSDKKIGIVSPILKEKKDGKTIYALGAKFNPILGRTKHKHVKIRPLHVLKQELVSGCAMLIKNQVFKKIGLLDERFFLYFEDSDFCLRAKEAGYKIFVQPKSIITHRPSTSLGGLSLKKIKYNLCSNFLFILKWVKPYFWPIAYFYLLILGSKMMVGYLFLKKQRRERKLDAFYGC